MFSRAGRRFWGVDSREESEMRARRAAIVAVCDFTCSTQELYQKAELCPFHLAPVAFERLCPNICNMSPSIKVSVEARSGRFRATPKSSSTKPPESLATNARALTLRTTISITKVRTCLSSYAVFAKSLDALTIGNSSFDSFLSNCPPWLPHHYRTPLKSIPLPGGSSKQHSFQSPDEIFRCQILGYNGYII